MHKSIVILYNNIIIAHTTSALHLAYMHTDGSLIILSNSLQENNMSPD